VVDTFLATPNLVWMPEQCLAAPSCLKQPHSLSWALAIYQVIQGQGRIKREKTLTTSAESQEWLLLPGTPRRALSPSGSLQGPCLYLAKPGKMGGISALGLRWIVTLSAQLHLQGLEGNSQKMGLLCPSLSR
jgi:hypothetical protein